MKQFVSRSPPDRPKTKCTRSAAGSARACIYPKQSPAQSVFVAANPTDPVGAIIGAVNVGYDTDTIATMTGAIAGALHGADAFPAHYLPTLEKANNLPIQALSQQITALAAKEEHHDNH